MVSLLPYTEHNGKYNITDAGFPSPKTALQPVLKDRGLETERISLLNHCKLLMCLLSVYDCEIEVHRSGSCNI